MTRAAHLRSSNYRHCSSIRSNKATFAILVLVSIQEKNLAFLLLLLFIIDTTFKEAEAEADGRLNVSCEEEEERRKVGAALGVVKVVVIRGVFMLLLLWS